MKKLLKAGALIAVAAALVVGGVFAATSLTWSITGSTVNFTSKDVFVDIDGAVTGGTGTDLTRSYSGSTYTSVTDLTTTSATAWTIGDISFDTATSATVITVTLTFTNAGSKSVDVTITPPDDIIGIEVAASHSIGETEFTEDSVTLAAFEDSATFVYAFTLTDYRVNITGDFDFGVSMIATPVTP